MGYEKPCYNGYGNAVGIVLVLFILLVIILGTFWI
ncbi:YjcZ family sporulation protein [Paenibacillus lactis]|nr:YjcZ family sporulation protein [Paenibacillus lactis]